MLRAGIAGGEGRGTAGWCWSGWCVVIQGDSSCLEITAIRASAASEYASLNCVIRGRGGYPSLGSIDSADYSECRLNRRVLPPHSEPCSLLFFLCAHFSLSASWLRLVLEKRFDWAAMQFVKNSGVSGTSFFLEHYKLITTRFNDFSWTSHLST